MREDLQGTRGVEAAMTTPSTTVFVDGTPDGRSASEATSVTSEDNLLQPSVMRRRHFELMAVPVARDDHRYPSSASFNASIDQQGRFQQTLLGTHSRS